MGYEVSDVGLLCTPLARCPVFAGQGKEIQGMGDWIKSTGFILLIIAVLLFVADRILGVAGLPPNPEIQVAHPPNLKQHRRNIEFEYDFVTNDKGLRYEKIPGQKPDGETRILVVGDSLASRVLPGKFPGHMDAAVTGTATVVLADISRIARLWRR
jgi:hypothetical protein